MKQYWKAGNMLYPLPAVMVSVMGNDNKPNIITIAWTGTCCTNPPYVYISVRKERYSYHLLEKSKEFVINLVNRDLTYACDFCGVRSGKTIDKFKALHLTAIPSKHVSVPSISESPVNIECKIRQIIPLGSHDMFLAEVVGVTIDDTYLDSKGRLDLNRAQLISYSHGEYYLLSEYLGKFGYSVRK